MICLDVNMICAKANPNLGFIMRNLKGTPEELKHWPTLHLSDRVWNMHAPYGILAFPKTVNLAFPKTVNLAFPKTVNLAFPKTVNLA